VLISLSLHLSYVTLHSNGQAQEKTFPFSFWAIHIVEEEEEEEEGKKSSSWLCG
jgi:hypothetical protein